VKEESIFMAEEEKNDNTETEAPAVEPEVAAEATPEPEAEAAPEPKAEAASAAPAEVTEQRAPKERKRRARSAKAAKAPARAARTSEERDDERVAERRLKAAARRAGRQRARTKARAARDGSAAMPPREHQPRVQKTRQGIVVSDRADKTITVRIDLARRHRRYEKIVRTSNTLHAHDEGNDAHIGDTVIVRESRPLSRTKRWRLVEVVERAK
jgi:small subunit ribosomal protein S17